MSNEILIIGPNPTRKGGIATHVGNLKSYKLFEDSDVFEIGSRGKTMATDQTNFLKMIKSLWLLRKKVAQSKSTVLINTSLYDTAFIKLILIFLFLPTYNCKKQFVFYHGGRFEKNRHLVGSLAIIFKFCLKKVDRFYFLSEIQKNRFKECVGDYPSFLYNNYSQYNTIIKRDEHSKKNVTNFIYVGRLVHNKGLSELLMAIDLLVNESIKDFHIDIVGEGEERAHLEKQISNKNLEDHITLHGYLQGLKLQKVYENNDWFILPSHHEGFPYVFIESMRFGLPIIATKTGALKRVVQEGRNGFLIEPQRVEELRDKMKFIIKTDLKLSENCHSFFKKHLSKKKGEEFYSQLIEKRNGQSIT